MKKMITCMLALLVCISFVLPVAAEDGNFVPSITYKPAPEIVTTTNDAGDEIIGEVKHTEDGVISTAVKGDLVITPVSGADTSTAIPEEAAKVLKQCYQELNKAELKPKDICAELEKIVANFQAIVKGDEKLAHEDVAQSGGLKLDSHKPTEKDYSHVNVDNLVVKDLFDVSILDEDLAKQLENENHSIDLTFDVSVAADDFVAVLVFKNEVWSAVKDVVNNGNGSITCTFEHFCPVAILTAPAAAEETPDETTAPADETTAPADETTTPVDETTPAPSAPGASGSNMVWYIVAGVALVLIIILILTRKKEKKDDQTKAN